MIKQFIKRLKQEFQDYNKIELNKAFVDEELINLDYTFAQWIYPRLKRLSEITYIHPSEFTLAEWKSILEKNSKEFEAYLPWESSSNIDNALDFFKKYYSYLWY